MKVSVWWRLVLTVNRSKEKSNSDLNATLVMVCGGGKMSEDFVKVCSLVFCIVHFGAYALFYVGDVRDVSFEWRIRRRRRRLAIMNSFRGK